MKKIIIAVILYALAEAVLAQTASPAPQGMILDWTQRHVLFPESPDVSVMERVQTDPRWLHNWYLRHPELWWLDLHRQLHKHSHRDWSVSLGAANFEPLFDSSFTFGIGTEAGYGTLSMISEGSGTYLATSGSVTVTSIGDEGTYALIPGGPGQTTSANGAFYYDDVAFPSSNPTLDEDGLLFSGAGGLETNIWGNSPGNYSFYTGSAAGDYPIGITTDGSFTFDVDPNPDPGGGQTFPAKYVFNINQAPNCANDYVVIGLPAIPASGGQANILGINNLYSNGSGGGLCTSGPTVMFAYASGSGQVPASVVLSQNGTQIAYIENRPGGSAYFHVLALGTTGTNGTSATNAAVPGTGNNAVDESVLLSPNGGTTVQPSTTSPWVVYTSGDTNDFAFATTYSDAGTGYLYKIGNVFNGQTPTILWSLAINAIPSSPVRDQISNKIFFTDSKGRIDYVVDSAAPSVTYGTVLANGATSVNPVIVDSTNQMVYATFNSNGTNSLVAQTPTSLASPVSVPVGAASTVYTGPYEPDFNNAWYTGSGTPLLYIAGTGSGTVPTLYSVGFNAAGVLNSTANATTAALATGAADSSPVTEFYNPALLKDYIFVGVTNNCVATTGGTGGCVMSLDITNGFPTVNANSTALAAAGGTSGIVADNDSSASQASNIYYTTKTGETLVKATQSGLD